MTFQHLFRSRFPLATELRATVREGYRWSRLRSDLAAGLTVGLVALPLAMALAIASGVPPQYGLYTAIVAGGIVPLLGGARFNVSGPTAAFVVILVPVADRYGIAGLMLATIMAGAVLIVMGAAKLGQLIKYIPYPVTTGFTAGIGLVIATMQIKDLLGLSVAEMPEDYLGRALAIVRALPTAYWPDLTIGALTLAVLIGCSRYAKKVPAALVAMTIGALAAWLLGHLAGSREVATIGSRFHYEAGTQAGMGIPPLPPMAVLPWHMPGPGGQPVALSLGLIHNLIGPAFAIAVLGAIESLLCAVVADGMTGRKHRPDTELMALGLGNIIAPFFGGFAATGAIARTAANIRAGATSPLAAVFHALFLLATVLVLAPILSFIPMASLAALLLLIAWNMSDAKHVAHIIRIAPRSDMVVLVVCFSLTVFFDMVVGVGVGIVLAAILFMRRMAEITNVQLVERSDPKYPSNIPGDVLFYEIAGPLFFGATEKAMATLGVGARKYRAVIFNLERVPTMDITGLVAFTETIRKLEKMGTLVLLAHVQVQPAELLERAGVHDSDGLMFCHGIEEALFVIRIGALVDPETSETDLEEAAQTEEETA